MTAFYFSDYILDAQRPTRISQYSPRIFKILMYISINKAYACTAISSSCKDVTGTLACSAAVELWAVTMTLLERLVLLMAAILVGRITSLCVFLDCKGTRNFFLLDTVSRLLLVSIQLASSYITYFLKNNLLGSVA